MKRLLGLFRNIIMLSILLTINIYSYSLPCSNKFYSVITDTLSDRRVSEDLFNKGLKEYENKQYRPSFDDFFKSAELGHLQAGFYVGEMYFKGLGVKKRYSKGNRLVFRLCI